MHILDRKISGDHQSQPEMCLYFQHLGMLSGIFLDR